MAHTNAGKRALERSGPWAIPGVRKALWFPPVSRLTRGPASSCLWPPSAIPAADKRVGKKSQIVQAEGCTHGGGRTGPGQSAPHPHAGPPRLGDSHSRFWAALCFGVVIRGWRMWGTCPTLLCPGSIHLQSCPSEGSRAHRQSPAAGSPSHWPSSVWAGTSHSLLYLLRVRAF